MKHSHKILIGIATVSMLSCGSIVLADNQIDPYTDKGATLEIQKPSTLSEGGMVTEILSKEEPKVTLKKWGDEVQMGITYTGLPANTTGSRQLLSKTVAWEDATQKMDVVPVDATTTMEEGGMEINITLNSVPASNVFTFQLDNWDNLDFFYQPPLTDEQLKQGYRQPDTAAGSYAVYYKNHKDHQVGHTNYGTGKAFHIFRPLITDARGATTWGVLSYANGILTVTVPQTFLDTAKYPVIVDPTFGYTSVGANEVPFVSITNNSADVGATERHTAGAGENITQFSVYSRSASNTGTIDMAAYTFSGAVPVARLSAATTIAISSTAAFYNSATVAQSLTNGTTYVVAQGNYTVDSSLYYDLRGTNDASFSPPGALAATWTESFVGALVISMYATYTVAPISFGDIILFQ